MRQIVAEYASCFDGLFSGPTILFGRAQLLKRFFHSACQIRIVRNTGALLPMARGSFSDAAGFVGIISASSAHSKKDFMAAR